MTERRLKITEPSNFASRAAARKAEGRSAHRRERPQLDEDAVEAANPEVPMLFGKPYHQRKAEREARRAATPPTPQAVRHVVTVREERG